MGRTVKDQVMWSNPDTESQVSLCFLLFMEAREKGVKVKGGVMKVEGKPLE